MTRQPKVAVALLATLSAWQPVLAYDQQLSASAIRDAYYLGRRNDDKTRQVLSQYVRRPSLPASGPYVAEIEVRTPYSQAVLRAWKAPNYSAQQAAQDYAARPQQLFVRIRINVTPTFVPAGPDFWRDFKFQVWQHRIVVPERTSGFPVYGFGDGFTMISGAEVYLVFSAAQIANDPLIVEVESPDGRHAEARFDLARLR